MASPRTVSETLSQRPKRADARRNYDKLIAAAREAFAEDGTSASLEDIARRAEVGIGTLYRHFPNRQELLEAAYLEEVDAMARRAADVADLPPWDALATWLRQFVGYVATKYALAEELFAYIDRDAEFFRGCRDAIIGAGEPLLKRAQEAGVVRPDTDINDVVRMVGGIARMPATEPGQIQRVLEVALDGLRYRAPAP
jgi:AcrR family transcriptional regulator